MGFVAAPPEVLPSAPLRPTGKVAPRTNLSTPESP